jgi:hypothetical protein
LLAADGVPRDDNGQPPVLVEIPVCPLAVEVGQRA